jgi:hypothetical protein
MSEPPDGQDKSAQEQPFIQGLPAFPGGAAEDPPPPSPNRMRTWGTYGVLGGTVCGGVVGLFVALIGSPSLGEAVGIVLAAALLLGALNGVIWSLRGAWYDDQSM